MKQIKLLVIFLFFLIFFAGFGTRIFSPKVAGQGSLSAPTGVIVSDGSYTTKVGLNWDTIRGARVYQIFRSTSNNPANATNVGSTAANYFFDTSATSGQNYFYWVRAENGSAVSDFSQPEQGFRAVGTLRNLFPPYEPPVAPAENPVTATKAWLGKVLFWEEQLSSTRTVSCGTCHSISNGAIDRRTIQQRARSNHPGLDGVLNTADDVFGSAGVMSSSPNGSYNWSPVVGFREQVTPRRALPPIDNGVFPFLFWDGRSGATFRDPLTNQVLIQSGASLENLTLNPPLNEIEMGHAGRSWSDVVNRLNGSKPLALSPSVPTALANWIAGRSYPELFDEAFGTPEVSPARIAMAIATYERTLFSDRTPLDEYNQGLPALSTTEILGRNVMNSPVGQCNGCHVGTMLAGGLFRNTGVRPPIEDLGRGGVTNVTLDNGSFRIPTLRNVELRGAFFHNGRFTTLEEVVDFYIRAGDFDTPGNQLRPLTMIPEHRDAMLAFLRRPLTDPRVAARTSPFDHPELYSDSNRVPQITGSGLTGSGGQLPKALAIEPPLVGNPSFTVGVSNALGGANAVLVINSTDTGATTDIPPTASFARVPTTLQGSGAGGGYGSVTLAIPNNTSLVGKTFFGRWYVADPGAAGGVAVSEAFKFTVFGEAKAPSRATHADFDGDGKTDIGVWRASSGSWWYLHSSDLSGHGHSFGLPDDIITPGDFTGDGKTDVAIWRPSTGEWFVRRSEDGSYFSYQFGLPGDIPAPADYDGDGITDTATFRPSTATWYIFQSSTGSFGIVTFGLDGDRPVPADYDGDGKADIAVWRPSNGSWWIVRSSDLQQRGYGFGLGTDRPVPGDYTGDGKADIAVWRDATREWYFLRSEDGSYYSYPSGLSGDIPAPGDYDGDGRFDSAVFRPSTQTWYIDGSVAGSMIATFGLNGDRPVPNAFVP